MNCERDSLRCRVRLILAERGYKDICYPLDDLAQMIDETYFNVNRKVFYYKWGGFVLLLLIPVFSTVLSILVSEDKGDKTLLVHESVRIISYILTLLTLLNTIFKPGERFRAACSMGIKVEQFSNHLLARLETFEKFGEKDLLAISESFRRDFVPYQERLIGLFLPETAGHGPAKAPGGRARAGRGKSTKNAQK